jgi:3',5'-cyclic-AMP phosphodiesterase
MSHNSSPVVCVIPGDLHLMQPGLKQLRTAHWMVDQMNDCIRPDFVQFIGDNVQNATEAEFQLFRGICARLTVPYFALVGDHDVHNDPQASRFRSAVGEPYGAFSFGNFRFIRLNTLEHTPLGLTPEQIRWFRDEVDSALAREERVVVFQHHYPFKVFEEFAGPGIDEWREIVQARRITALFSGHTHYGQIANDGRNVMITTRSIGDPEGGPPGFTVAYLKDDDLAVTYRSIEDRGPILMITHPRELLLATDHGHIISGPDCIRVRTWSTGPVNQLRGCLDNGDWFPLQRVNLNEWEHPLPVALTKGQHILQVEGFDDDRLGSSDEITFLFDPTGRYTPIPRVWPAVAATSFC